MAELLSYMLRFVECQMTMLWALARYLYLNYAQLLARIGAKSTKG